MAKVDVYKVAYGIGFIITLNVALIFGIRWLLYQLGIGYGITFHLNIFLTFFIVAIINLIMYKNR